MAASDRPDEAAPEAPAWAAALGPARGAWLQRLLVEELEERALQPSFEGGAVRLTLPEAVEYSAELSGLVQLCSPVPQVQWPQLVGAYVDRLLHAEAELIDVSRFESVQHLLKLRMAKTPLPRAADAVTWLAGEDLASVLVFDLPSTVRGVSQRELDAWGRDHGEVQELALTNSLAEPVQEYALEGDGGPLTVFRGESFFVATRLLALAQVVPADHPRGALVCVPNRHTLLLYVIEGPELRPALETLVPLAEELFRDGPGALSPAVYWWRGGELERVVALMDEEGLQFAPSRALAAALRSSEAEA